MPARRPLVLRTVHLISMATWFAAALFMPGDVRRTLESPNSDLELLRGRANRAVRLATVFSWATLLSGIALIFAVGGFGEVPPPIHISLLLALVAIGVGAGLGSTWRKIDAELQKGTPRDQVAPMAKKLAMFSGIFQLLWLVILLLMVFRNNLM